MAFMFFKHPPTEARTLAKPQPTSYSFDERQLESGFGGWVDEKIKPARAADQHVSNECCSCDTLQEKPFKRRNSHPQHLTITLGLVVGMAAQKTIGTVIAGLQIAFTQPIRLDDVVIVENE